MKRGVLCLLSVATLCLVAGMAWGAAPVIEYVDVGRGTDQEPSAGWMDYHQGVTVCVRDDDGAADIVSVSITDTDGVEHVVTPGATGMYDWSQRGECAIAANLWDCDRRAAPPAGYYIITAVDRNGQSDTLTTPYTPEVAETCPEPLSPHRDQVINVTAPTFQWATPGVPSAYYQLFLTEEGEMGVSLWSVNLGELSGETVSVPCGVELERNRSYLWVVDCAWPEESSNPRVSISTRQRTFTRFTVYGAYPSTPPWLPGRLAYTQYYDPVWAGRPAIMEYEDSAWMRTWLTSDYCQMADWSPDGTQLLYYQTLPRPQSLCIDSLDGAPPVAIPGSSDWQDARWAADGKRIVYSSGGDIWVAYADGSHTPYPLVDSADYTERYPSWSSDGLWVAYGKVPAPDGNALWLIRHNGTGDHPLIPTGVAGFPDYLITWFGWEHAWSPDANELAVGFCACGPDSTPMRAIGTISLDGGPVTPVFIAPPDFVCCAMPHDPAWSPDGTQIVFSSGHHLTPDPDWANGEFEPGVELWVAYASGLSQPRRLTYDHSWDGWVSWWDTNTNPGDGGNGHVKKGPVDMLAQVDKPGTTKILVVEEAQKPAPPENYTTVGEMYDISTTAELSGPITVRVQYDESMVPGGEEDYLHLLHEEAQGWVDITTSIDTENNTVEGQTTSLSVFALVSGPNLNGLLPPINNDGSSIFKLNRTVPVKFRLVAPDGGYVTDALAQLYIAKLSDDIVGTVEEPESTSAADSGNTFRYDPEADQYIFNLATASLGEGTWLLRVVVNGMIAKEVLISLR